MQRVLEPEVMDSAAEAAAYDAMDHAAPNAAFAERTLDLLGERRDRPLRVLDIGAGNGVIALILAERLPRADVVGVDLSEAMLAVAERHRAASPHAARVRFEIADAKALGFGDAAFDAVLSNTILHHLAEPAPFLREAWRVLRPGGVLLIRDLFRPADDAAVERLVREHAGREPPDAQQLFRQSLKAALTPDELRAMVGELGWTSAEVTVDTDRHVSIQTAGK